MAMRGLAAAGVDLILSGHLHLQYTGLTAKRYQIDGYSALLAQTGTTISTRGRGEANSFNCIRVERGAITIQPYNGEPARRQFDPRPSEKFIRETTQWVRA